MILVTRDPALCPQCKMLKMKLDGGETVAYELQDADSAEGMATMAYYEANSVPCLILDDDTVVHGVEQIMAMLQKL